VPEFPLLIIKENEVFGATSLISLFKIIEKNDFSQQEYYDIIDCTNEGWAFYPKHHLITPIVYKKNWYKKEIVQLFNNSNAIKERQIIPLKDNIYHKTFSQIVEIIVDRLIKP
jgi:hypothetical protein